MIAVAFAVAEATRRAASVGARLALAFAALFAWRTSFQTPVWLYEENEITGDRRAVRVARGERIPLDLEWLAKADGEASYVDPYAGGRRVLSPDERQTALDWSERLRAARLARQKRMQQP